MKIGWKINLIATKNDLDKNEWLAYLIYDDNKQPSLRESTLKLTYSMRLIPKARNL